MLQANELRIGNWVKSNNPHDGRFVKLKYFHEDLHVVFFYNEAIGAFVKDIVGIELTPEILEKCGFERLPYSFSLNRIRLTLQDGSDIWLVAFNANSAHVTKIKHFHQLQNLYFALTGEELTFKP